MVLLSLTRYARARRVASLYAYKSISSLFHVDKRWACAIDPHLIFKFTLSGAWTLYSRKTRSYVSSFSYTLRCHLLCLFLIWRCRLFLCSTAILSRVFQYRYYVFIFGFSKRKAESRVCVCTLESYICTTSNLCSLAALRTSFIPLTLLFPFTETYMAFIDTTTTTKLLPVLAIYFTKFGKSFRMLRNAQIHSQSTGYSFKVVGCLIGICRSIWLQNCMLCIYAKFGNIVVMLTFSTTHIMYSN